MADLCVYIWIVIGIVVSLAMPVVCKLAGLPRNRNETGQDYVKRAWSEAVRRYVFLAMFFTAYRIGGWPKPDVGLSGAEKLRVMHG